MLFVCRPKLWRQRASASEDITPTSWEIPRDRQ
jgi:hypothetical protein